MDRRGDNERDWRIDGKAEIMPMKVGARHIGVAISALVLIALGIGWKVSAYHSSHVPLRRAFLPSSYRRVVQFAGAMAFSPDGRTLAVAETLGSLSFWDAKTLRRQQLIDDKIYSPDFLSWAPDKSAIFVANSESLCVVDPASGHIKRRLTMAPPHSTASERFDYASEYVVSPAANLAAGGEADGALTVWNVRTGRTIFHVDAAPNGRWGRRNSLCGLVFSPDDHWLATAMLTSAPDAVSATIMQIDIRDAHTGRVKKQWIWQGVNLIQVGDYDGNLRQADLVFSPDGNLLASTCMTEGSLWNLDSGKLARSLEIEPQIIGVSRVLRFTPDGKLLAGVGWGDRIHIWRTDSGKLIQTFHGAAYAQSLAISPDGKRLISGGQEKNSTGSMQEWDISHLE